MSDLPVKQASVGLKAPTLEWAADAASGQLNQLTWVDASVDPSVEPFQLIHEERRAYRHRPYSFFLPKAMAQAAQYAQRNGEPTVVEALQLLYANTEWLVAARRYLWSPLSPVPKLMAILTEAFGIGPEIHRNNREALSRLVARLPTWYPDCGTIERAGQLLEDTVGEKIKVKMAHVNSDGPVPKKPSLLSEVFVSRNAEWWAHRSDKSSKMKLRVKSGMLLFQSDENSAFPLIREDVLIAWTKGDNFPTNLLRLLPMWICIRIVVNNGVSK